MPGSNVFFLHSKIGLDCKIVWKVKIVKSVATIRTIVLSGLKVL
jgi:hypothetical protein